MTVEDKLLTLRSYYKVQLRIRLLWAQPKRADGSYEPYCDMTVSPKRQGRNSESGVWWYASFGSTDVAEAIREAYAQMVLGSAADPRKKAT